MNKKMFVYLFVLAAITSTQANASTITSAGFTDSAFIQPLTVVTLQAERFVQITPETVKPAVVIMGDSADLYLLFSHHVIGFNRDNESSLPEAGRILDSIR